jgi:hypothetical protein
VALRVLTIFLALSLACSNEAAPTAFGCMKGIVVNWSEGATAGSFDLDAGGKLTHFAIDMRQGTVDGVSVSRWAKGAPSPFGTLDNPKRVSAWVAFSRVDNYLFTAISIYTGDKGCRALGL